VFDHRSGADWGVPCGDVSFLRAVPGGAQRDYAFGRGCMGRRWLGRHLHYPRLRLQRPSLPHPRKLATFAVLVSLKQPHFVRRSTERCATRHRRVVAESLDPSTAFNPKVILGVMVCALGTRAVWSANRDPSTGSPLQGTWRS